ncbi:MAG: UdgX family uracil-DNA binding protein [Actinomycetota bacterium]|nr:UdgX family uracil-DNA binding protein [Actinomycetota bacterium]
MSKGRQTAAPLVPHTDDLESMRAAASGCRACPLWESGTQTVFGEGGVTAEVMFVGEQPGDKEDLAGKPFVGPAGRLLDDALQEAGIDRTKAYVTNIVKHFKWEPRGKRRIHKKPNMGEINACKPWLEGEIRAVGPRAIVCLGSSAAQGLLGKDFKVTQRRGELLDSPLAELVMATVHPSSILRARDDESRNLEMKAFVEDLAGLNRALRTAPG